MVVEFFGTGTSHGIPVIGCDCPTCASSDSRDTRLRTSTLIREDERRIAVDTGPEFRLQMLRAAVPALDAVLYTHSHADHMNGIDDLRIFCYDKPFPVYGSKGTIDDLLVRFPYVVSAHSKYHGDGLPHLDVNVLNPGIPVEIAGFQVVPVPIVHGGLVAFGYRIGGFAYLTDCNFIPEESYFLLEGLDVVVLDGLRFTSHPTHFSISQAIEAANRIGASRTYLTHISHDAGLHADIEKKLPSGICLAYDGLILECSS
ncbi:MBL fold metallo-hydrolase [Parasphaerochaeta coccoides]|uniref:MBL fold metallo-hydrolase n=1 Tax=Parasphaerochaeta coccoides TaxID=273376 RepID=UPI0002E0CAD9|nr:MBL fold metallo-hydrolase [Parasphaerochaeta coccoides]